MDSDLSKRTAELFDKVLQIDAANRDEFLRRECGDDKELFDEVSTLLKGDEAAAGIFSGIANDATNLIRSYDVLGKKVGRYRVLEKIGSGGMGEVYLAEDTVSGDKAALKILPPYYAANPELRARFIHEIESVEKLDHPNIIRIVGRSEESELLCFAMEYAEGGSLAQRLKEMREPLEDGDDTSKILSSGYITSTLEKFIRLADALGHMHSKGMIHRDIKPGNILLSGPQEDYKLADFGIARTEDMTRITRTGDFVGTVRYIAPELLSESQEAPGVRSDVYSLGVSLYEALTLTTPFNARSEVGLVADIITGKVIPPRKRNSRLTSGLEIVLTKAISTDPLDRYASASDFAADLKRILEGKSPMAGRDRYFGVRTKIIRRTILGMLGVGILSAAVIAYWPSRDEPANTVIIEQLPTPLVDSLACCVDNLRDDFEDGDYSPLWVDLSMNASIEETDGSLVMHQSERRGGASHAIARLTPDYQLCGEFEIMVDFELIDWEAKTQAARFAVLMVEGDDWSCGIQRHQATWPPSRTPHLESYKAWCNNPDPYTTGDISWEPTEAQTGRLRISRDRGTIIASGFWDGSQWIAMRVDTVGAGPVTVSLWGGSHGVQTSTQTVHFDNFIAIGGVTDSDNDGLQDCLDNCPDEANSDQADSDGDGIGDVCDTDSVVHYIGDLADAFDDGLFSPLWTDVSLCGGSSVKEDNGALVLTEAGCEGGGMAIASFTPEGSIVGDFDVQVEFELVSWGAPGKDPPHGAQLWVSDGTNEMVIERRRRWEFPCSPGDGYKAWWNFSDPCQGYVEWAPSNDTLGKFRIVRSGNVITSYYWRDTAWIPMRTDYFSTASVEIRLILEGWHPQAAATPSVRFDNFKLISAVPVADGDRTGDL